MVSKLEDFPESPLPFQWKKFLKEDKYFYYNSDKQIIGSGSYGKVYRGQINDNKGTNVAIKVMPAQNLSKDTVESIKNEINMLKLLNGSNVLKLLDHSHTKHNFYLIMEYCNGPSLREYLEKHKVLTEQQTLTIVAQIVDAFIGLREIKSPKSSKKKKSISPEKSPEKKESKLAEQDDEELFVMMHRDLKPANIMFHDWKIKIVDFGYAKLISNIHKSTPVEMQQCGTPYYQSPQILKKEKYSSKCDVWSTGIIMYECLFGKIPFTRAKDQDMLQQIGDGLEIPKVNSKGKEVGRDIRNLLKSMLAVKESERASWEKLDQHALLRDLIRSQAIF